MKLNTFDPSFIDSRRPSQLGDRLVGHKIDEARKLISEQRLLLALDQSDAAAALQGAGSNKHDCHSLPPGNSQSTILSGCALTMRPFPVLSKHGNPEENGSQPLFSSLCGFAIDSDISGKRTGHHSLPDSPPGTLYTEVVDSHER